MINLENAVISDVIFEYIKDEQDVGIYETLYVEFNLSIPIVDAEIDEDSLNINSIIETNIKEKVATLVLENVNDMDVSKYVWQLDYNNTLDSLESKLMSKAELLKRVSIESIEIERNDDKIIMKMETYC